MDPPSGEGRNLERREQHRIVSPWPGRTAPGTGKCGPRVWIAGLAADFILSFTPCAVTAIRYPQSLLTENRVDAQDEACFPFCLLAAQ